MDEVIVTIFKGDDVVVQHTSARICTTTRSGSVVDWDGCIVLPVGVCLGVGAKYALRAHDGRSGDIRIASLKIASDGRTVAEFAGCGPLA